MSSPNLSAPHSAPPLSHPRLSPTRSTCKHQSQAPARSHSPDTASSSDLGTALGTDTPMRTSSDHDEVPPIVAPCSPVRSCPSERDSLFAPSINESVRMSIASSNIAETGRYPSLLDAGIGLGFGGGCRGSYRSLVQSYRHDRGDVVHLVRVAELTRTEGSTSTCWTATMLMSPAASMAIIAPMVMSGLAWSQTY